jgi:hypothetical protein
MVVEKLTGRTMHRLHRTLFGKNLLVLQVEVHRTGTYHCPDPQDWGMSWDVDEKFWRDATVTDLQDICCRTSSLDK